MTRHTFITHITKLIIAACLLGTPVVDARMPYTALDVGAMTTLGLTGGGLIYKGRSAAQQRSEKQAQIISLLAQLQEINEQERRSEIEKTVKRLKRAVSTLSAKRRNYYLSGAASLLGAAGYALMRYKSEKAPKPALDTSRDEVNKKALSPEIPEQTGEVRRVHFASSPEIREFIKGSPPVAPAETADTTETTEPPVMTQQERAQDQAVDQEAPAQGASGPEVDSLPEIPEQTDEARLTDSGTSEDETAEACSAIYHIDDDSLGLLGNSSNIRHAYDSQIRWNKALKREKVTPEHFYLQILKSLSIPNIGEAAGERNISTKFQDVDLLKMQKTPYNSANFIWNSMHHGHYRKDQEFMVKAFLSKTITPSYIRLYAARNALSDTQYRELHKYYEDQVGRFVRRMTTDNEHIVTWLSHAGFRFTSDGNQTNNAIMKEITRVLRPVAEQVANAKRAFIVRKQTNSFQVQPVSFDFKGHPNEGNLRYVQNIHNQVVKEKIEPKELVAKISLKQLMPQEEYNLLHEDKRDVSFISDAYLEAKIAEYYMRLHPFHYGSETQVNAFRTAFDEQYKRFIKWLEAKDDLGKEVAEKIKNRIKEYKPIWTIFEKSLDEMRRKSPSNTQTGMAQSMSALPPHLKNHIASFIQ